ncbi:MAG: hypothetical protein H0V89_04480 [Deltaproteobacteria bacterium]|nr:hypothetical protein [Deltaproteobacteria bacterium]
MVLLTLLLACDERPSDVTPPADTDVATPSPATDEPWGVASTCSAEEPGGFDPFYADGTAFLVYGETPEDLALAEQVQIWYADFFDDLQLRRASELTVDDRAANLMILGMPATNALIGELDGTLAVRFDDVGFEFGGYRYDEPGHGIALVSPSPLAPESWVLLYAGNTLGGAFSVFTVFSGGFDYVTTRGRGTVQQEGDLCHDEWTWFRRYGDDLRKPWDEWVGGLLTVETAHHLFFFEDGSDGDRDADWYPAWQEEEYDRALAMLEVAPLDFPIRTYLYTTRDLKEEMTGFAGNGHANDLNYEVHALYGEETYAVGAHEDVHVLASHRIGQASTTLMGEGLAVWVDGVWVGEPLASWATTFRDAGEIPPLQLLIDNFWGYDDLMTYALAGHFVGFLVDGWGIEATKRIYAAPDLEQALLDETGLALADVEAAWLGSIL